MDKLPQQPKLANIRPPLLTVYSLFNKYVMAEKSLTGVCYCAGFTALPCNCVSKGKKFGPVRSEGASRSYYSYLKVGLHSGCSL